MSKKIVVFVRFGYKMEKKVNRKSASKWDQCGERVLIEVWNEKMPQLRGCRKNSHILMEMASELEQLGYKYSVEELKTKMHNMTTRYRKEKTKIGSTGGSPSEWDLYKDMENLLSSYKSYHQEGLVADCINNMNTIIQPVSLKAIDISAPSMAPRASPNLSPTMPSSSVLTAAPSEPSTSLLSPSPPPKSPCTTGKIKKNNIDKIITCIEKNFNKTQSNIASTSKEMLSLEREKTQILKKFAEKEAEVQNALLEFLKKS